MSTEDTVVVASAPTRPEAEVIRTTLVAHGIEATLAASDNAFPAADSARGVAVSVLARDEEAARRLLADLEAGPRTDAT